MNAGGYVARNNAKFGLVVLFTEFGRISPLRIPPKLLVLVIPR